MATSTSDFKVIACKVSEEDKDKIRLAASMQGLSVQEWLPKIAVSVAEAQIEQYIEEHTK